MSADSSTASLDRIDLGAHGGGAAAFKLARTPEASADFRRADGWRVTISESSAFVVASGPGARSYADAVRDGVEVAQQGLDFFSAEGLVDLATIDTENDHIMLWKEREQLTLRITTTSVLRADVGTSGARAPRSAPDVWHQSMRFYRQSQLSEDLFDSIRSLWLATENLLDSIEQQRPGESEQTWLKRALDEAARKVDLSRYLPDGSPKSPRNQAYEYFYDQLRVSIFHAKGSRGPQLPHDVAGAEDLAERHERLTRLYLDLVASETGVRRLGGAMTYGGFDAVTRRFGIGGEVQVSDDATPLGETDVDAPLTVGNVISAPAAQAPSLDRPGLRAILATFDGNAARSLTALRRIAMTLQGRVLVYDRVNGELVAPGVDRLEVQLGLRLRNVGLPRSFAAISLTERSHR